MRNALLAGLLVLTALIPHARGAVISATNSTPGNFDASSGIRSVSFTGAEAGFGSGQILDVNISINFAKADGESFDPPYPGGTPFYNEIHFTLAHGATTITLIEGGSWGAGSGLFDGTITFDDAAAAVVNFGPAPVAGTFRPTGAGALSAFNNAAVNSALGSWDLFIQDTVGADALRFRNFTLSVETDGAAGAVPEPSTLSMLALGAFGWAGLSWRRRAKAAA